MHLKCWGQVLKYPIEPSALVAILNFLVILNWQLAFGIESLLVLAVLHYIHCLSARQPLFIVMLHHGSTITQITFNSRPSSVRQRISLLKVLSSVTECERTDTLYTVYGSRFPKITDSPALEIKIKPMPMTWTVNCNAYWNTGSKS